MRRTRAIKAITARQSRIIFALDATASREPTWAQARRLHGELFSAALSKQTLAVQLCYYRGLGQFVTSDWLTQPGALLDQMSCVTCEPGSTQIGRVIQHALETHSASQPLRAVVLVGDACEESAAVLASLAGRCAIKKIPLFLFQEGNDAHTRAIFKHLAQLSHGAYAPFDASSADQLRALLAAVSRFAQGGIAALRRSNTRGDRTLLCQLEKTP